MKIKNNIIFLIIIINKSIYIIIGKFYIGFV